MWTQPRDAPAILRNAALACHSEMHRRAIGRAGAKASVTRGLWRWKGEAKLALRLVPTVELSPEPSFRTDDPRTPGAVVDIMVPSSPERVAAGRVPGSRHRAAQ